MLASINIDFHSLNCDKNNKDTPIDIITIAFYNIVTKERIMIFYFERDTDTDKNIILQLINIINEKKPKKIVGYNFEFEYNHIQKRCEILGITMDLLSLNKISKFG